MKIGLIAAAIAVSATAASAQTLTVDGEEGVTYTVIAVTSDGPADKTITTRRAGDGTTTYSQHAVSCDPYRAGLMGTAATLDAMNETLNLTPELGEIIRFSAEDVISGHACAN